MRYLLAVVLMLALFCVSALAQNTDAESYSYEVAALDNREANRLIVLSPGYFMWSNVGGSVSVLSADPDVSPDSTEILTNYHERLWALTIKSRVGNHVVVKVRESGPGAPRGEFTDNFDIVVGGHFWTDSLFKDVPGCTFDWTVCFADTGTIQVNDVIYFRYLKTRYVQGSGLDLPDNRFGALGTFSLPSSDTTTILVWDTITAATDTIWTTSVPADMGYITLFIDQYPKVNTNESLFGAGLQVKMDDGPWAFPVGNNQSIVEVLWDSAAVDSGVVVERVNNVPADSVRYAFWGKGAWDIIFRKVRALWRD